MKVGKPKSKRTPVRLRHKIEKASAAKKRKERREAKKNPQWRSRLKKDPGIPNLFPYKERMLNEIEQGKVRKEEDQRRRREEARARREGVKDTISNEEQGDSDGEDEELLDYEALSDDDMGPADDSENAANPMAALLASARQRAQEFAPNADPAGDLSDVSSDSWAGFEANSSTAERTITTERLTGASSSQSHTMAFNTLLSSSDVLLYILDARDPITTRSPKIEQQITSNPSKRLFLILNKIDLVPPATLFAWLRHLRRSFPTLPVLSPAMQSADFAKEHAKARFTPQNTIAALLHALKARSSTNLDSSNPKSAGLTVGILGHPNTGKSTIINSLLSTSHQHANKRNKTAAPVGAEAGVTAAIRSIKLDSKLRLLDAPGIVFPFDAPPNTTTGPTSSRTHKEMEKTARLMLLNALPNHDTVDPMPAVDLLLSRACLNNLSSTTLSSSLLAAYQIPALSLSSPDRTNHFLIGVARARGRLGKGGVPNLSAAARAVLSDWWAGRIKGGWIDAPSSSSKPDEAEKHDETSPTEAQDEEKKIVNSFAEEFKLEGLWGNGVFNANDAGADVNMQE
ncbi:MAG: hypothetical protein Q9162_007018 [Coniocarpon cinnabarinum]